MYNIPQISQDLSEEALDMAIEELKLLKEEAIIFQANLPKLDYHFHQVGRAGFVMCKDQRCTNA